MVVGTYFNELKDYGVREVDVKPINTLPKYVKEFSPILL